MSARDMAALYMTTPEHYAGLWDSAMWPFVAGLAPPGMFIGYNKDASCKKVLSDKPDYEGGPEIFSLDKVQDKAAVAASYDFIYARVCNNRAGMGYASSLTEQ